MRPRGTERVEAVIIRKDEKDIRAFRGSGIRCGQQQS